ncbi:MAG: von Willebrand factor type A domain-containing protein [Bacilli bacterium]
MKKILYPILLIVGLFILSSCSSYDDFDKGLNDSPYFVENGDEYLEIRENPFLEVSKSPNSYFSLDTSTASYANLRRMINNQVTSIPKDSIKIEEMINYFSYDYDAPTEDALSISAQIVDAPWNSNNKLLSIGVKAKEVDLTNKKPSNIVLLLDVSGSMLAPNKLPLLQSAFKLFVENLDANDTISIVTYASSDKVLLNGVKGFEKNKILAVIEDLEAGGSTAGSKGIQTAYELAKANFIPNGHNRVIIGTDGDFNVGISTNEGLKNFISQKRDEEKIYLSVLGFGYGNLKDNNLEVLATSGNGTYAYIDSITEARKVLVDEIGGTLNIVSKDTKVKVTFDPSFIKEYRLIGYENQMLSEEEYNNNKTDAGEIGAGHTTTAIYELVLNTEDEVEKTLDEGWVNVEISYKDPETEEDLKINKSIDDKSVLSRNEEDILFISAVAEFGLVLRDSKHKGTANLYSLISRIEELGCVKDDALKKEFLELVKKYKGYAE